MTTRKSYELFPVNFQPLVKLRLMHGKVSDVTSRLSILVFLTGMRSRDGEVSGGRGVWRLPGLESSFSPLGTHPTHTGLIRPHTKLTNVLG